MLGNDQYPVLELLPEINLAFEKSSILILQAPPGAGKSTVLPLHFLSATWLKRGKIVMLEPRRLAATSVARRMASLLNENVGETIGYRVRFDQKISKQTKIEVVTEGILTRLLQNDNSLDQVNLVIFDEFHERSLHGDLALALLREVQQVLRDDLKILIMSATLDGQQLAAKLNNAPILTSNGRQHPIQIEYAALESDEPIHVRMSKNILKAMKENSGDLLAFLPGAGEIHKVNETLLQHNVDFKIFPLFGDLPYEKQQEAILPHPAGNRKVVLATSIAETSLTIEGITIVIDSGLSRVSKFDPKSGLSKLVTVSVTKDAADQRAGRAGRLGPGKAYRLWTSYANIHINQNRTPEILEADLAALVLELAHWGINDLNKIAWITPPPAPSVTQANELLNKLGALENGKITIEGKALLQLPTHPRIAHLLVKGKVYGLIGLAADIAGILEERDPLPKNSGADICSRIIAIRNWRGKKSTSGDKVVLERIERLAASWRKAFNVKEDNSVFNEDDVGKLVAAAYPERIAKQKVLNSKNFRLVNGRAVAVEEHDSLTREKWLAIAQLDAGKNEGKIFLAAPLNINHLNYLFKTIEVVDWDYTKGLLLAQKETRIDTILVESSPLEKISDNVKIKILCEVVKKEGNILFNQSDRIANLQARLGSLQTWLPDMKLPDISINSLVENVYDWLPSYVHNIKKKEDFFKINVDDILMSKIPWETMKLIDTLVPETIKVPSGSAIQLRYFVDASAPVLAVRLQEMFGLVDTPCINQGKIKVMLHLLSPGYKPVQVTQDLHSFWKSTYLEIRKEFRAKYPRHHWPEDPWTAEAVKGAKKRK